jgi:hypothetical protein
MTRLYRKIVLMFFCALIILSVSLVGFCVASEVKPSVPTFTIEEISSSYDVPPSSTTDPYTGVTTTKPGYTVEDKNINIKIKNQPFEQPLTMQPGDGLNRLFYQYRYKGHYADDNSWKLFDGVYSIFLQSYFEYTLIPFPDSAPRYGQVDIQVRAGIGHFDFVPSYAAGIGSYYEFSGVYGDWSDIVVVSFDPLSFTVLPSTGTPSTNSPDTLTPDTANPSPSDHNTLPTLDPDNPVLQTSWTTYLISIIVIVCLVTITLAIVTYLNRQQKIKPNL